MIPKFSTEIFFYSKNNYTFTSTNFLITVDRSELKAYYDKYFNEVYVYAKKFGLSQESATEVVSNAFIDLFKVNGVEGEINIRAFLLMDIRDRAIKTLREQIH